MDFFITTKHSSVNENVLFTAKILFELIDGEKHVDELFNDFATHQKVILNLNMERILYLSLVFLYSIELIYIKNNTVKKVE